MTRVLFVCLGNICRSPTAEGVLRHMMDAMPDAPEVEIDSAGTGGWHVGNPPDPRAIEAAARRGIDLSALRVRQVTAADFDAFDYVLAMDRDNLRNLKALRPAQGGAALKLLLEFGEGGEVPDPYYGGEAGFDRAYALIEGACRGLIREIQARE